MKTPTQKLIEAGRGFGRSGLFLIAGIFVVLWIWVTASQLYREIATRHIEYLTIKMIDAPRTCVSHRTRGFFGLFSSGPQRSSAPSYLFGPGLYCGHILTDRGKFFLPESNSWAFWNDPRELIADSIEVGCRYSTTIVGYQYGFENRQMPINTISEVRESRGCKKAILEDLR